MPKLFSRKSNYNICNKPWCITQSAVEPVISSRMNVARSLQRNENRGIRDLHSLTWRSLLLLKAGSDFIQLRTISSPGTTFRPFIIQQRRKFSRVFNWISLIASLSYKWNETCLQRRMRGTSDQQNDFFFDAVLSMSSYTHACTKEDPKDPIYIMEAIYLKCCIRVDSWEIILSATWINLYLFPYKICPANKFVFTMWKFPAL